jgi:hypothetical protein
MVSEWLSDGPRAALRPRNIAGGVKIGRGSPDPFYSLFGLPGTSWAL